MTSAPPAADRRRVVLVVAQVLAVAVLAVAVWLYVDRLSPRTVWHHTFDLRVYRGAVQWWLDGRPLYDFVRPHTERGFTYPPFAVLCLLPLALGSETTATVLMTTVSGLLVVLTTWWLIAPVAAHRGWPRAWAVGLAVPLVVAMEPVREALGWGQIDLVIAALVLADVVALRRGRRWAGVGIGLATAIKLTPGLFVVYLAVTRRWRAAAVAAGTFSAATLLAGGIDPSASIRYWTSALWDTGRVGEPAERNDQSLLGLIARFAAPRPPSTVLWVALVGAVVVAGLWRARRLQRRGDDLAGFVVTGLTACLITPIAWVHHLYWVVPAVVVLLDAGSPAAVVAGVLTWGVFTASVIWLFPGGPTGLGPALGKNAYVLVMLGLVAALPARLRASPSAARTTGPPRPAGSSPR